MKKVNLQQKDVLAEAAAVLSAGGVVMHPTETCYGFAVDVANLQALDKLYKLKGRDANKPVSILVADLEMAKKYGDFSEKALELAENYWPGPLTILVPRLNNLPKDFNQGQEFVGIRCPDHKFSRELVKAFGGPITTTSANVSGEPPLYEADLESFGELADEIDLVVDGGEIPLNKPSTIAKVVGDNVEVIRQGDLIV
ncbi:MAG: L-threonylcarbamoyladenylate synthase [Candidatus Peregrinibacteria bacterium]|nr:L-threonylcarbamoyladenylate synthase [Candidatus Peregrinibacteria bacterium]